MGVLLAAISAYFFARLNDAEKRVQTLEIRAAVIDSEKATIIATLSEIKADVKAIKTKVGTP